MREFPAKTSKRVSLGLIGIILCGSVLGTESNNQITKPTARYEEISSFNLAKLSAEARVVYVSSGSLPLGKRMIDGNLTTAFTFSPSDFHPTVIVELGQAERVHRVSALSDGGGRVDIYLLNKLGADGADVLKGKPVASIDITAGGQAAVNFEPRGVRYLALRWSRKKPLSGKFRVTEIGAFAVGSTSVFDQTEPPSFIQSVIQMTSNGGPDVSNTLGTLAVPPVMPPDLAPTSP